MELRNVKTFLYVAEQGSFSKTATILNYSQSTVTAQIQKLEEELGVLLFERIHKYIRLTPQGEEFLQYAHKMIRLSESAKSALQKLPDESGYLRIAMAESICDTFFPIILEKFHELYPKIKICLETEGTGRLHSMLQHNDTDLVYTLDKRIYSSELVTVMEKKEAVVFVASSEHEIANKKCTLKDLMSCDFLLTEKNMSYRKHFDEYIAANSWEVEPFLEHGSVEILKGLVKKNVGISFLPEFALKEDLRQKKLVKIDVPEEFYVWRQLIYHKKKWVTAPMRAMINLIKSFEVK